MKIELSSQELLELLNNRNAIAKYPNKVFSSTGATYTKDKKNVEVGVTAHCKCGNIFVDDIRACRP